MKPQPLPEEATKDRAWESWPKLETLHAETGLSIATLRRKLAAVLCCRCPDKSVRYEPDAARAAVYDFDDDDDQDDDDPIASGELSTKADVYQLLARELLRSQREERKERAELVRVMQTPMDRCNELCEKLFALLMSRNSHLEGLWDRMVLAVEGMASTQAEREIAKGKAEHTKVMREKTFGLVEHQLPTLLNRWQLTSKATLALNFIASLDPLMIDGVIGSGALDPEQVATLTKLRDVLAAERRTTEKAKEQQGAKNGESQPAESSTETPPAAPAPAAPAAEGPPP
jgi:hypothetical protein